MSPEIRIGKPRRLIPKSLLETVLTLVVATIFVLGYLQLPSTPKKSYEIDFVQFEATGQLFYADEDLTSDRFEKVTVTEIVDGDTIKVSRADSTIVTIRYIGIDTPEIKHQGNGEDEPYGQLATEANSWLVNGKTIYLQNDATDTDRYGRLLRYVYTDKGIMINYALIRLGYATILTIPPNVAFQSKFYAAQQLAREEGKNLFAPK